MLLFRAHGAHSEFLLKPLASNVFSRSAGIENARFSLFFPCLSGKVGLSAGNMAAAKRTPDAAGDPESKGTGDQLRLRITRTIFGRIEGAFAGP